MSQLLEIVEGAESGRQVTLAGPITIGRDPSVDLVLHDSQVSRRHASIYPDQHDGAAVEDLGSSNGTYVNGQVIHQARRLNTGDEVRLGLTMIKLRSEADVAVNPSAIRPRPELTRVDREVLRPVAVEELASVEPSAPPVAQLRAEESEPAFVSRWNETGGRADALAALVDARVKRQTNVTAFALLAVVGLGVAVYFGAT